MAASTLIILFSEMLKLKKEIQIIKSCESKYWIFKNILLIKMKFSKLINEFIQQICVKVAKVLYGMWNRQTLINFWFHLGNQFCKK